MNPPSGDEETLMTGSSDNRSVSSEHTGLNSDIDVESGNFQRKC